MPDGWERTPPELEAGLWLRAAAGVIDATIALLLALAPAMVLAEGESRLHLAFTSRAGRASPAVALLTWLVVSWLYQTLAECSRRQATPGKRALGLRVVDGDGGRLDFARASRRTWAKLLSAAPLLAGFALAAWPPRHRALHDRLTSTRVIVDGPRRLLRAATILGLAGFVLAAGWASVVQFQRARYGERSASAYVALDELVRAERTVRDRTGAFAPVAGTAGTALAANRLDWAAPAGTGFTFRLTTITTTGGEPAFAACAEADLDGDGVAQAVVVFEPAADAQGALVAPAAPCSLAHQLERPLTYTGEAGPLRVTPPGVF